MPLSVPGLPGLPPELAGPVAVQLAKPVATIPAANALPGGCLLRAEVGRLPAGRRPHRRLDPAVVQAGPRPDRPLPRRRRPPRWPRCRPAPCSTARSSSGTARGWTSGCSSSGWSPPPGGSRALVAAHPASYVAFDLLAAGGTDLRGQRLSRRRAELEELAARWAPPMQLSPATADPDEARRWFDDFRPAGVEGLVAKGAGTRYAPGRREWLKVKSWETTEVLAGGVIGPIERPSQLVAGRYRDGELVVVGRTSPLSPRAVRRAGRRRCSPAGDDHPWPDRIGTGRFGGGQLSVPLTRVDPAVVVEVSADAALQAGVFRHPLRFVRVRPDLDPRTSRPL